MTDQPQFDEQMSRILVDFYATDVVAKRRQTVRKSLDPKPGEHILDIGSGPGHVAKELGELVGTTGRILGIDISDQMVTLARNHCADFPWITFEHADATDLPVSDASFDAAVTVHVFNILRELMWLSQRCFEHFALAVGA